MKRRILLIAVFFLSVNLTACSTKKQVAKLEKLKLIAGEVNALIEREVAEAQDFIDSNPQVGEDKSSIVELQKCTDDYASLIITIPEEQKMPKKELEELIVGFEEKIIAINSDLLVKLEINNSSIEETEKSLADKKTFDALFSDNCLLKMSSSKITEQKEIVMEAVAKESRRLADRKLEKTMVGRYVYSTKSSMCPFDEKATWDLTLKKNGKFELWYPSCNSGGYGERGTWKIEDGIMMILIPTHEISQYPGSDQEIREDERGG